MLAGGPEGEPVTLQRAPLVAAVFHPAAAPPPALPPAARGGRPASPPRAAAPPDAPFPLPVPVALAQFAEADKLEQQQAWAGLAQPVALADASAHLLRWANSYSRLPLLLSLTDRMEQLRQHRPPPPTASGPAAPCWPPCLS